MTAINQVGNPLTGVSGSGSFAGTTSPVFVTPTLGAASATSVSFGGTALANYVESTFVPVIVSSGGGTCTYSAQSGLYTRIGNRVFFNINVTVATSSLSTGTVSITALPVALSTTASSFTVYCSNLAVTDITQIMAFASPGASTTIQVRSYAAGTVTTIPDTSISAGTQFIISGQYQA